MRTHRRRFQSIWFLLSLPNPLNIVWRWQPLFRCLHLCRGAFKLYWLLTRDYIQELLSALEISTAKHQTVEAACRFYQERRKRFTVNWISTDRTRTMAAWPEVLAEQLSNKTNIWFWPYLCCNCVTRLRGSTRLALLCCCWSTPSSSMTRQWPIHDLLQRTRSPSIDFTMVGTEIPPLLGPFPNRLSYHYTSITKTPSYLTDTRVDPLSNPK